MSPINIPHEGKGRITLRGYCFVNDTWRECEILEASAKTQSASVRVLGSLFESIVTFRHIANIALKYGNGEILQNFGAPRASNPASLAYIQYQDQAVQ